MPPKILVVSPSAEVSEIAREMAPKGFDTVVISDSEVLASLPNTEYMVCYPHVPMKDAFYKAVPKLKLVQLLSAGYDNVDLDAARRAKVPLSNNGGANAISVSEHAIMLMLTVARKVIWQHGSVSGGRWRGNGPVIEAGLGAVAVLFLLDAFVAASFCTAGVAFGLAAVFVAGLLRAAGAVFLTVLT